VVHDRYKYVAALFDGDELYDLEVDPFEMRNLVDDLGYADVCDDLRARLIAHMETHPGRDSRFLWGSVRSLIVALTHAGDLLKVI
jgi:hypothetical protein